ncbi:phage tail protein, partial [Muribacter muris]|uniref:phage tail-collar fiber domain-containing protein n=1 Tax=Muribacter muris TaxID=67855 RepID=UPI000A471918
MATLATTALEQYIATQTAQKSSVKFDEIIFANIPNLTAQNLQHNLRMPTRNQIVHRQAISQSGVVNRNAVVYSVTLGTEVGDFDFNFIGLVNSEINLLAVAVHTDTIKKVKNKQGIQGNSITRSILLEFTGAQSLTNINVSAETWQIDFTARLHGIDEKIRLTNRDLYDRAVFFDNSFKVSKASGHTFNIEAGFQAGLVQLNNTLTSSSTTQALTAAQGKALKDELDALSVGGRNYLRNGRFENALAHWQNWGDCTRRVETTHNKKWLRLTTDNRELYRGIAQTVATFERNARYTLSFKAYSRRENAKLQLAVHQIPNNNPQVWSSPIAITDTPQTYVWSFTSADLDNKTGFHLMLGGVREQPFDIYLTDIKFEKGHRRSDWSAAPEDVMDSVQDYVRTHYVAKTGDTMT